MTLGAQGSGRGAVDEIVGWVGGAVDWLGNLLDPVGEILASIWPPVLAAIAAIVLLRTVRWLLLLWRGRTPRVQISTFAWAMSDDAGREATWVTSLFREQLATLRLDALDPLPERAPGAPLVEIVEGVGQGVGRDVGAAAARLFRAAWPDSAYEVWGTLRPREGGGGRISVQLIERRRGNRTLLNVALEQASWEDGAREAALAVAGALYPQVSQGERGPWTKWTRPVPRDLLDHYHSARRYEAENRLEQALFEYHAALDQDPLNPNLRLKIAMLQERLELYIDAWVTYEAIVDESDRRAWQGPDRRVYLLALYRLAVMLSNGRVAGQWVKGSSVARRDGTLRDRERHDRRDELLRSLESSPLFSRYRIAPPNELHGRLTRTVSTLITRSSSSFLLSVLHTIEIEAREPPDALRAFRGGDESEKREGRIEAVLQILGLRRLEELEAAIRILPIGPRKGEARFQRAAIRHRLRRPEFARSAVRTSKLLVRMRIAARLENQVEDRNSTEDEIEGDDPTKPKFVNRDKWIEEIRAAHRTLAKRWPFPPVGAWRRAIHYLALRRRWASGRRDSWQIHYNAACTAATVLRSDSVLRNFEDEAPSEAEMDALPEGTDEDRIVKQAIAQLEEYAYQAGSDRVAAQADWVALDDPDLSGLRDRPELKLWASHHLPRRLPKEATSRKADVKRFIVRIAREGAYAFASTWRERAREAESEAAEIAEWWRAEAEIWAQLGNAWREHLSWEQRLQWLQTLQAWLRTTETDGRVDFSYEARGAAADTMSPALFRELGALASDGADGAGSGSATPASSQTSVLSWVDARAEHARAAHEAGEEMANRRGSLRHKTERREALRAARVWTRLGEALDQELTRPGDVEVEEAEKGNEEEATIATAKKLRERDEELQAWIEVIRAELPPPGAEAIPARLRWVARNPGTALKRSRGRRRRRRGSRRSG
ncbi:MAG TPA: hypothetical protein VGO36_07840 [Solirubrobacterales bacterium]|jgi:hypothetical protein|nr:hypothetical protein [Solirubrobacterales bacterium]